MMPKCGRERKIVQMLASLVFLLSFADCLSLPITRRELGAAVAASPFFARPRLVPPAVAASDGCDGGVVAKKSPLVAVIGASGRTGLECVRYCVATGRAVRACTRHPETFDMAAALGPGFSGRTLPCDKEATVAALLATPAFADVTKPASLGPAVSGADCVVFAATAPAFGEPVTVDDVGLTETARACIANGVPRLVVVSGGGITKTNSPAYRFLNRFGGRMDAKVHGEEAVRALYRGLPPNDRRETRGRALSYTIVRPSGLMNTPFKGPAGIEINQGDNAAGFISRADLAAFCVEAGLSPAAAGTTFECYDSGTATSTESLSISEIISNTQLSALIKAATLERPSLPIVGGRGRRGASFEFLFAQLITDEI